MDPGAIEERPVETVEADVLKQGAAQVYQDLDQISVSRGAELAQTSVREFEAYLSEQDIDVGYGPESSEGLHGEYRL